MATPGFDGKTFAKQAEKLKKTAAPKAPTSPKADTTGMDCMRALYKECAGDIKKLAKRTACDERLMKKNPPKSEEDFAQKMLAGAYAPDDGMHG
mmetsp:Transcript_16446/g.40680  ORF Transcript_16446/g.40680 Transcript_16446/m.40680 type:complete len:94 (+) Transcript_16446:149-430(+)